MNVFLDANILVSVLNKEYPIFPFSSRILSLADIDRFKLFTSPICLAISFYFAEKKHRTVAAKHKIDILCQHLSIAGNSPESVFQTLKNKSIHDFEDGLEYYSAKEQECNCIITEDKSDFYFADIEVLNSMEFCGKYLNKTYTK